jgi:hypothetical protein
MLSILFDANAMTLILYNEEERNPKPTRRSFCFRYIKQLLPGSHKSFFEIGLIQIFHGALEFPNPLPYPPSDLPGSLFILLPNSLLKAGLELR